MPFSSQHHIRTPFTGHSHNLRRMHTYNCPSWRVISWRPENRLKHSNGEGEVKDCSVHTMPVTSCYELCFDLPAADVESCAILLLPCIPKQVTGFTSSQNQGLGFCFKLECFNYLPSTSPRKHLRIYHFTQSSTSTL